MATNIDYYWVDLTAYSSIDGSGDIASATGQSFTAVDGILNSCWFEMYHIGNLTGNLRAEVYAHTGTY